MTHFSSPVTYIVLTALAVTNVSAEETLNTLLPPPGWFRRHAEELNIDAPTRQRLEQIYQEKEPRYHQLKYKVERLTNELYPALARSREPAQVVPSSRAH